MKTDDLPAPLGPMMLTISFSETSQVELGDRPQAPERERQLVELEQRHRQTVSTRCLPSSPYGRAAIVTIRIAPSMIWVVIAGLTISRDSQQQAAT